VGRKRKEAGRKKKRVGRGLENGKGREKVFEAVFFFFQRFSF
jgi:hypothetical protein